jgi:hypothetical protein
MMDKALKKHRKLPRLLVLFLVVIIAITAVAGPVFAGNDDINPNANTGDPGVNSKDVQGVIDFLVTILKYFTAIGGVVVVGALIYNGYKLAFSVDPRGKAEAMDGLKYAIIGGIIAFGAYRLAGVLKGLADKL